MKEQEYCKSIKRSNVLNKASLLLEQKITLFSILILGLCIIILSFGIISTVVNAKKLSYNIKSVKSVKIEKGDTLWSIASQYITDEYNDMNEYIDEIKECNGLTNDIIHEDCYIIVPYFSNDKLLAKGDGS